MPKGIPIILNPPFNTNIVAVFVPYETPVDILVKLSQRKICGGCSIVFPFICFGKNKNTKDGLSHLCKNCIDKKSRENYEKNKTIRKAQNLRNYHKNTKNNEKS